MLSKQEEEQERRATLENDRRVREQQSQGTTMFQHAQAHAGELSGGRFAAIGAPRVVGSTPNPSAQYPAASAAHQTELPPEPALGYPIDQPTSEPSAGLSAVEQLGGAAAAPSAPPEHAAPPSSQTDRDESR
jgi:hypothetical protein